MARRTPATVTRDAALDVSELLLAANVTPHTLAILLGEPPAILSQFLARGIRPSQKIMRDAKSMLKRIIELRSRTTEPLNMRDAGRLRQLLNEDADKAPQYQIIRDAYFSEDHTDRETGTVRVTMDSGIVKLFRGIDRGAFFRWQQDGFEPRSCPPGVHRQVE
jgi:hypothetical protein